MASSWFAATAALMLFGLQPASAKQIVSPQGGASPISRSGAESGGAKAGSLDPAFGHGGKVVTLIGTVGVAAVALQSDGKIVVLATTGHGVELMRYLGNGSIDAAFGQHGSVKSHLITSNFGHALAIEAHGKILVAGTGKHGNLATVARFNPSGTLDTTFGSAGKATAPFQEATAILVQPDNKIVIGGGGSESNFARFLPSGQPDPTFGNAGVTGSTGQVLFSIGLVSDGSLIGVGSMTQGSGLPIEHFSSSGKFEQAPPANDRLLALQSGPGEAVTLQDDGKVVFMNGGGGGFPFQNARYTKFNEVDPTFQTPMYDLGDRGVVVATTVETNGKLLVGGSGNLGEEFATARFNADGAFDATFGNGGEVFTAFKGEDEAAIAAFAIQSDGKIVAVGSVFNSRTQTRGGIALVRYLGP